MMSTDKLPLLFGGVPPAFFEQGAAEAEGDFQFIDAPEREALALPGKGVPVQAAGHESGLKTGQIPEK